MPDHPEALPDAERAMAEAELRYTAIPVPFDAPREQHYASFRDALDREDGPVHVHCIMNWRVSAFFYRYNRENGMPEAEARALLQRIWDPENFDYPNADKWAAIAKGEASD